MDCVSRGVTIKSHGVLFLKVPVPKVTSSLTTPLRCVSSTQYRKKVRILRSRHLFTYRVNYFVNQHNEFYEEKSADFFKAWPFQKYNTKKKNTLEKKTKLRILELLIRVF